MTIRGTENTELEKFQAMRIKALEKQLNDSKELLKELKEALELIASKIDVKEFEIVEHKN